VSPAAEPGALRAGHRARSSIAPRATWPGSSNFRPSGSVHGHKPSAQGPARAGCRTTPPVQAGARRPVPSRVRGRGSSRQPCGPPAPGRHRVEHLRSGAGAAGRDSGAGTSAVPPSARAVISCWPARDRSGCRALGRGPVHTRHELRDRPAIAIAGSGMPARRAPGASGRQRPRSRVQAPGALRCGPP
jgi:hypothetical protein